MSFAKLTVSALALAAVSASAAAAQGRERGGADGARKHKQEPFRAAVQQVENADIARQRREADEGT